MEITRLYQRRRPENDVLYQAVRNQLPAFFAAGDTAERPVPTVVCRALEAFLACSVIEKTGAIRVRCPACGFDSTAPVRCRLCHRTSKLLAVSH